MAAAIRTGPLRRKTKPEGCVDSGDEHEETIRRLHAEVRDLPESARHKRLLELGADPLLIAETEGSDLMRQLGNSRMGLPYTVVIDRSGSIVMTRLGNVPEAQLDEFLGKVIRPSN